MMNNRRHILALITLICIISVLLFACASKTASSNAVAGGAAPEMSTSTADKATGQSGISPQDSKTNGSGSSSGTTKPNYDQNRKIIWSANASIETLEFDKALTTLNALVKEFSGYIENSSIDGAGSLQSSPRQRNASFTLRIPSSRFDEFLTRTSDIGNVLNTSKNGQEITEQYFDTEAHLSSLKIQESRLLQILNKASELKDVIELEKALADVRYQIETLTGTLRKYDSLVSYSTVNVSIREVAQITQIDPLPKSLSQRIAQRFFSTIRGLKSDAEYFVIWLVGESPVILINLLVLAGVILLVRKLYLIYTKKAQAPRMTPPPAEKDNTPKDRKD